MKRLKAGELRHRIAFQQVAEIQNPLTGAITQAWSTFRQDVPADILPVSSGERLKADAAQDSTRVRFLVRYDGGLGVTGKMRILHEGMIYNIVGSPIPDRTLRRHFTIDAEEGLIDG